MKSSAIRYLAILAGCFLLTAGQVSAVTFVLGEDELLGKIVPATPASAANATEQVRFLVQHYNAGGADGANLGNNPNDPQNENYTLYRPDAAPTTLVAPQHETKVDTSNPEVNLGGNTYQYILFFQANKAYVYYIGNITTYDSVRWGGDPFSNAGNVNGSAISHYSLFNGSPTLVPDNATTALLLGIGLVLLGIAARRRKAA